MLGFDSKVCSCEGTNIKLRGYSRIKEIRSDDAGTTNAHSTLRVHNPYQSTSQISYLQIQIWGKNKFKFSGHIYFKSILLKTFEEYLNNSQNWWY